MEGEIDGRVKSLYGVKGCAIMGRLVYKLYDLTAEEIKLVEEGTRK